MMTTRLLKPFKVIAIAILLACLITGQTAGMTFHSDFASRSDSLESGVVLDIRIPWQTLSMKPVSADGQAYTQVLLSGIEQTLEAGMPALPVISKAIGAPAGAEITVSVTPGPVHKMVLDAPVLPAATQKSVIDPEKVITGAADAVTLSSVFEPAKEVYASGSYYPRELVTIASDGYLRSQRVLGLQVNPVQYNPAEGTLLVYESLKITIQFTGNQVNAPQALVTEPQAYEDLFSRTLENYEQAKGWRQTPKAGIESGQDTSEHGNKDLATATPWQPPEPGYRISITETGIHKLTYDVLASAGLPVDTINPTTFQMFYLGNEISIFVSGESDGEFDPQDYLLFYGEKINDKYTKKNVYWLTYGLMDGARMAPVDGTPAGAPTVTSYSAKANYEQNIWYVSLAPGADELERYLWAIVYTEVTSYRQWNYTFNLPAPDGGGGTLTLNLMGALQNELINQDHHAIIRINNVEVGNVFWDGITWQEVQAEIPAGLLQAGANQLTVAVGMDTGAADFFYVDGFQVSYSSGLVADPGLNALSFEINPTGSWTIPVSGFTSPELRVFDISDPAAPRFVENAVTSGSASPYTITLQAELTQPGRFLALAETAIKSVLAGAIQLDSTSTLQATSNQAEYIIISHASFLSAADQLAVYREAQGVTTLVADLQDVYDEFNFGVASAMAIRNFIAYAYEQWQTPAPSKVLLVGDGNYDPKNNLGTSLTSYLPPYLAAVDPWITETAADNKYVSVVGNDNLPDLALGRFAVTTLAEAESMVAKILTYEQPAADVAWQKSILALAGEADEAGDFALISDNLLEKALPPQYVAEKNYFRITYGDIASATAALKAGINSGKLIVNFIGHGFSTGWSADRNPPAIFLRTSDVAGLTNAGKYPIILAMTCTEGAYHHPTTQAMGEVITKAANKGAIASWSPTGQGVSAAHDFMDEGFFDAVFSDGVATVGEATMAGLLKLWLTGSSLYTLDAFILFGDPNLVIPRPPLAVDDEYFTAEDTLLSVPAGEGVLRNDMGLARGNPLTALLETPPNHGTFELNADGSFEYYPDKDWFGQDRFVYQAYDGVNLIGSAEVFILVLPVDEVVFLPFISRE